MRVVLVGAVLVAVSAACASPSRERSALLQSGVPVLLLSGGDGQPVAGASLRIGAERYVSDANGRVDVGPVLDGEVEVEASRFLPRETLLGGTRTLTLWPTGPDYPDVYVRHLLYKDAATTRSEPSLSADAPLRRVMATTVAIAPDDEVWADRPARAAHERAVEVLNAATDGRVRFELRPGARAGVVFRAYVDGSATAAGALTYRDMVRSEIVGGRIAYADLGAARSERFVTHELGHVLGLQHSIRSSDLMYFSAPQGAPAAFSEHERLSIRLLLLRRAGNRYPDDDRNVSGASFGVVTSVVRD